jgi:hypothetical protein
MGNAISLKESGFAKGFKFQRLQWFNDGRLDDLHMIRLRAMENIEKNKIRVA